MSANGERGNKMFELIRRNLRPGKYYSSLDKAALEEWHTGKITDDELKERIFRNKRFHAKAQANIPNWGIGEGGRSIGY